MAVKRVSRVSARGLRGSTDWKKVQTMTDEEIKRAAMLDPDARELRDDELVRFRKGNR